MEVSERALIKRVTEYLSCYSMFGPGQTVGVAVSGGADSVCLLHVLAEIAPRFALRLKVLHLNHQLRGEESARDEEFVRNLAASMGLPACAETADVERIRAESGDNLEQAARRIRRKFLSGFVERGEVDRVALGHTRSDQAETVLFRLLRGSGTTGIAGMLPVTPEGFVRPLLCVGRADVERFLTGRGVHWREDLSNRDLSFSRNRIRHELLPALSRDWNPALEVNLDRMATLAADDEQYWSGEIERLAGAQLTRNSHGILLEAGLLSRQCRAVSRRLVRRAFEIVKGDLRRIEFGHVEQVLQLAEGDEGHGRLQAPGLDIFRSFDWILVARPRGAQAERGFRLPLPVPGRVRIPGSGAVLYVELEETETPSTGYGYNTGEWQLDWSRLPGPLELRDWRPGDRYCPVGAVGEERIKSLFQRARVPLWERRGWPVISCGETIIWARRFGPAAEYAAAHQTRQVLKVGEVEDFTATRNLRGDIRRLNE